MHEQGVFLNSEPLQNLLSILAKRTTIKKFVIPMPKFVQIGYRTGIYTNMKHHFDTHSHLITSEP
jgi:hypothetical protein